MEPKGTKTHVVGEMASVGSGNSGPVQKAIAATNTAYAAIAGGGTAAAGSFQVVRVSSLLLPTL